MDLCSGSCNLFPFFFIASGYLYWRKEQQRPFSYLKRILILYLVWIVLYLPVDFPKYKTYSLPHAIWYFCYRGAGHGMWFLLASILSFLLTYLLLKIFPPHIVFAISLVALLIGCLNSTWSPLTRLITGGKVPLVFLGSRNGLLYGFPYTALGMMIGKHDEKVYRAFFILYLHTKQTILWMSVVPYSMFFFLIIKSIHTEIPKQRSIFLRHMSTLLFVSHGYFLIAFSQLKYIPYYVAVTVCALLLDTIILILSEKKPFRFLQYLY